MKPLHGEACSGKGFDPEASSEEPANQTSKPRAAPAPGVPVSNEELKRLKREAEHKPAARGEESQKDRPKEKG
ncbi:MAG TPA: hypothetical protein VEW46_18490 [Pyrinomonadaceae bacterium]|nr:hypothetical protein [Pyrinomonadaceae bacterium]